MLKSILAQGAFIQLQLAAQQVCYNSLAWTATPCKREACFSYASAILSFIPGVIQINMREVERDVQVEAVSLIPAALPGKPTSLQVRDTKNL